MILSKTLSLLLAAAATSTIFVVEGAEMMGYLMDNRCISLCEETAADESCTPDNANSFYTPQEHTGGCLLYPSANNQGILSCPRSPTRPGGTASS